MSDDDAVPALMLPSDIWRAVIFPKLPPPMQLMAALSCKALLAHLPIKSNSINYRSLLASMKDIFACGSISLMSWYQEKLLYPLFDEEHLVHNLTASAEGRELAKIKTTTN